jgi:nicotinamidase-related amidase
MIHHKFFRISTIAALVFALSATSSAFAATPSANNTAVQANGARNAYLSMQSRDDTVLLLVDHQIGLFTGVRDINVAELKHNVVALAKAAQVLGIPVIVTATMPDGMFGPTIPELTAALPGVQVINRTVINAWDDPRVVAAVKKTGRKQLLIAGVSLEVCATFPALSAKADGYDSRVVLDASGTFNDAKRTVGLQRLVGAGVPITDYATSMVEMLRDNADPKAHDVYGALDIPFATLVWQLNHATTKK